jgi:hypothetical protein
MGRPRKKREEPTLTTSKTSKTTAKVVGAKSKYLEIDGVVMLWKSRIYINGVGTVGGKVLLADFEKFKEAVKELETEPLEWVSSEDLMAKAKKEALKNMEIRNGLS